MYGTAVAVFLVIVVAALQGSAPAESPFPFHIPLDPEGTLELSWNVSYAEETVYFQLLVRELKAGVLFGMSDRGELENADLVVLWTDRDGAYFGVSPPPPQRSRPSPCLHSPSRTRVKGLSLSPLRSPVFDHPCVPSLGVSDADVRSTGETGGFPDRLARPRSAARDGGHADHIKHSLSTPPRRPWGGGPHPLTCTNNAQSSHAPKRGPWPAPPGRWCLHPWGT